VNNNLFIHSQNFINLFLPTLQVMEWKDETRTVLASTLTMLWATLNSPKRSTLIHKDDYPDSFKEKEEDLEGMVYKDMYCCLDL